MAWGLCLGHPGLTASRIFLTCLRGFSGCQEGKGAQPEWGRKTTVPGDAEKKLARALEPCLKQL